MKLADINKELKNKRRNVRDIIRFMKTRTDNVPNYSLLIGAGCSVTSGIRPATNLIAEWRKEIYINLNGEHDIQEAGNDIGEKALTFLQNPECSAWYDPRNEYACLFEKRYDLPRQRRMFVEQEVSGKKPSIGYAYLMKIIESEYLNTVFTTNFDDLINEAFYLFSDQRPIVCAHDSAITSITVTSKRPKIIKLHGDYLFDDIKSTLRETESLEENIKNKFIEFAKDYGLLVVGYAGNDRSVMDVLFHLLKREEYFKHGLYWCLRENDEINNELRKLLWRDRVYFVEIKGFDELMAKLNNTLNNGALPVETSIISTKADDLVTTLINNKYLENSKSKIIANDLKKLNERRKDDLINSLFTKMLSDSEPSEDEIPSNKKNKKPKLSLKERIELIKLKEKVLGGDILEVYNLIETKYTNLQDRSETFAFELLSIKAGVSLRLGKKKIALESYEKIFRLKKKISILLEMANLSEKLEDSMGYIEEAIGIDQYDYRIYVEQSDILLNDFDNGFSKLENFESQFLDSVNKGIKCFPALTNRCWNNKFNYYLKYKEDNKEECYKKCEEIISKLEDQDPNELRVVRMKLEFFIKSIKNGKATNEDAESYVLGVIDKVPDDYKKGFYNLLIDFYFDIDNVTKLFEAVEYYEKEYDIDDSFFYKKARIVLKKQGDIDEAIKLVKQAIKIEPQVDYYKKLAQLYIFKHKFKEAKDLIEKYLGDYKEEYLAELYEEENNIKGALEIVRSQRKFNEDSKSLAIKESYLLLRLKLYKPAHDLTKKCLEKCNFTDPVLLVNYELARKWLGNKVKIERIQRYKNNEDKSVRAAVAILMGNKKKSIEILYEIDEEDKSFKYVFKNWPILESLKDDEQFKQLIAGCDN